MTLQPLRREFLCDLASLAALGTTTDLWIGDAWSQPVTERMPFAVGIVDAALGYSIARDEGRGDYAQAQRLAEQALAASRVLGRPDAIADALRAAGVTALLQGNAGRALSLFAEIETWVPKDPARLLWSRTYAFSAFESSVNRLPGGTTAGGVEADLRHYKKKPGFIQYSNPQYEVMQLAANAPFRSATDFVQLLYWGQSLHIALASHENTFGKERPKAAALDDSLARLLATTAALANARMTNYMLVVQADGERRRGNQARGNELLLQARNAYRRQSDDAGVAFTLLTEGDWLTAPKSTPHELNLGLSGPNAGKGLAGGDLPSDFDVSATARENARKSYAQVDKIARRARLPRVLAGLNLRRGYLAMLEGDYDSAVRIDGAAETDFQACGDHLGAWTARTHLLLARIGAGQFPEDRDSAKAIGGWGADDGAFSHALGLGQVCAGAAERWIVQAGDYERALACYRLSEALFQALGAGINQAQAMADQASVFKAIGAWSAESDSWQRAIDVLRARRDKEPQIARDTTQKMVEYGLEQFNSQLAAGTPDGLENTAKQTLDLANQLLNLTILGEHTSEQTNPLVRQASFLASTASDFAAMAVVEAPLMRARRARKAGDKVGEKNHFDLALTEVRRRKPGAETSLFEVSLHIFRKDFASARLAAKQYIKLALQGSQIQNDMIEVMRRQSPAMAQILQSQMQQRAHTSGFKLFIVSKDFESAAQEYKSLETLAGRDWWRSSDSPWDDRRDCAQMHEGLGNWVEAASCFAEAVELLESRRQRLRRDELKVALASGRVSQDLYLLAARNALRAAAALPNSSQSSRQALVEQGFAFAERGKSRGLLDLMTSYAPGVSVNGGSVNPLRAWNQANARIATWQGLMAIERAKSTPDSARLAYLKARAEKEEALRQTLESSLATAAPGFFRAIDRRAVPLDATAVATKLEPGTALLQYFFAGEDLLAWAVNSQGVVTSHLTALDVDALDRDVQSFHRACEQRQDLTVLGERIAESLLKPFAAVLEAHEQLIVVPHGSSHLLPFHALTWKGKPLSATHTVAYLPSASMLQFRGARKAPKPPDSVLAVGNPAAMAYKPPFNAAPEPLPSLPAAGVEAVHVAQLFPKGLALVGKQATAEAVRRALPKYRMLHFATHGHLSEEAPLMSSILLANGDSLTLDELIGLSLDADLVVLSACRTGQGKDAGGDEVIGLTRGLLAAGARAVVVSLWAVDDLATSLLMGSFYSELRQGKLPAAALQSAQNTLRTLSADAISTAKGKLRATRGSIESTDLGTASAAEDYSHPHFWAPFVFVG